MEAPLKTVVLLAVVALILIMLAGFFVIQSTQIQKEITECERNGGICQYGCDSSGQGIFKCRDSMTIDNTDGSFVIDAVGKPVCCIFQ